MPARVRELARADGGRGPLCLDNPSGPPGLPLPGRRCARGKIVHLPNKFLAVAGAICYHDGRPIGLTVLGQGYIGQSSS